MLIKAEILDDGKLKFTAGEEFYNHQEDYLNDERKSSDNWIRLMQTAHMIGNMWGMIPIAETGWLTDQEILPVSSDFTLEDNGDYTIHTIWYFKDYMLTDPMEKLAKDGSVVFHNGLKEGELEDHLAECPACKNLKDGVEFNGNKYQQKG